LDSFEKTVREAVAYYEAHQDYGPLAPILGLPERSDGLTGTAIHIVRGYPAPPELWPGVMMVKRPERHREDEVPRAAARELGLGSSDRASAGPNSSELRPSKPPLLPGRCGARCA
jgi:hypothetical protein